MDHHQPVIDLSASQQEWQAILDQAPVSAAAIIDPTDQTHGKQQ